MKNKTWGILWGGLYVACVLLSLVQTPTLFVRIIMTLAGIAFFVPAGVLLYRGIRDEERAILVGLRILSAASLVLSVALIVGIFLSVKGSEELGRYLQAGLILAGAPIMCFKAWAVSLFGWCCVFFASFLKKPKINQ